MGCKEKHRRRFNLHTECGDAYTFLAIERDTKLLIAWHVGRREEDDTRWFCEKLRRATTGRFQVSTDGFKAYRSELPIAFNCQVDYAQLIKIYSIDWEEGLGKYSPPVIKRIRKRTV